MFESLPTTRSMTCRYDRYQFEPFLFSLLPSRVRCSTNRLIGYSMGTGLSKLDHPALTKTVYFYGRCDGLLSLPFLVISSNSWTGSDRWEFCTWNLKWQTNLSFRFWNASRDKHCFLRFPLCLRPFQHVRLRPYCFASDELHLNRIFASVCYIWHSNSSRWWEIIIVPAQIEISIRFAHRIAHGQSEMHCAPMR